MPEVRVRELGREEADLYGRLRLSALADSPGAFGRTHEEESKRDDAFWEQRIAESAGSPSAANLVVEVDGTPAGLAHVSLGPGEPALAHVFSMWVMPAGRRAGAGRALLRHALEWARSRGATEVELEVTEGNIAAMSLYESAGFKDTGRRQPLRAGSHTRTIVMRRSVSAEGDSLEW
jgi:ribosomal protein S18 acetylase RimI-like enzyme